MKTKMTMWKKIVIAVAVVFAVLFIIGMVGMEGGDPNATADSYQELAKELKRHDFILPDEELLADYGVRFMYGRIANEWFGDSIFPIFCARGWLHDVENYTIFLYSDNENIMLFSSRVTEDMNINHSISDKELDINYKINGVGVEKTDATISFYLDDYYYRISSDKESLSNVYLEELAKNIIDKSK